MEEIATEMTLLYCIVLMMKNRIESNRIESNQTEAVCL